MQQKAKIVYKHAGPPPDFLRTPSTKGRKCFKKLFTEKQLELLEHHFDTVTQRPGHKEKVALAKKVGVNEFDLQKWFQSRRSKRNFDRKKKPSPMITSS